MTRGRFVPALQGRARAWRASPRWALSSRVLAAVIGGYVFTTLLTIAASLLLPMLGVPRAQGVLAASMASFLVYATVILAVFHAPSAARAWRGLLITALPLALVTWRLLPGALE